MPEITIDAKKFTEVFIDVWYQAIETYKKSEEFEHDAEEYARSQGWSEPA